MPNWAEGVLKIRGAKENVRNFLLEELSPLADFGEELAVMLGKKEKVEKPNVTVTEDEWDFQMRSKNGFHVKGTRRGFVEDDIEWIFNDGKNEVVIIENFKQAWVVDPQPFIEHSKKYQLDFKIYAFEKGMEFNQDIEINKGVTIKDNVIEFDDYEWECLMPGLGG